MNDLRKTILASILISLIVGSVAGVTGGIVATQLVYGDIGHMFLGALPSFFARPSEGREGDPRYPQTGSDEKDKPSASASDEESSTVEVVRRVSPTVVSILITKEVSARSTGPLFPEEIFREFGFDIGLPEAPTAPSERRQVGGGTGFIVGSDGLILTNRHVIFDDTASYTVVTAEGARYNASIVARDPFIDVGFLKIDGKNLPTVKLGDSDGLRIGETVIAIGNALSEFSNTITKGVVSGIKRRVTAGGPGVGSEVIEEAIQTDAAINPGNSGGPLVNLKGEVVGINTAVSSAGQLIGFATPINQAKPLIASVKEFGRIIRPWLGVRYVIITPELKEENQLPVDYGALVVRGAGGRSIDLAVVPGSPADKAGLKENDIILEVDGIKITEETPLALQVQKHKPGDAVTLKVFSQGKEREVKVVLEELQQ